MIEQTRSKKSQETKPNIAKTMNNSAKKKTKKKKERKIHRKRFLAWNLDVL